MSRLYGFLRQRMSAEGLGPGEAVTIAELHKRLLPYHACREVLHYATKAEYDVAMLKTLVDGELVAVDEPALAEAAREELDQPEPGLGFLQKFSASEIRVKDAKPTAAEASRAPEDCRSCGAELPRIEGVRFCPACGTDQTVPVCEGCGAELGEDWRYCALCGIVVGP